MELAEGIKKVGFRRWYERQLIESHAYLVTSFLCLVTCWRLRELQSPHAGVGDGHLRSGHDAGGRCGLWWTLRRYLAMLNFAIRAAERSVCEKCAAYDALELSGKIMRRTAAPGEEEENGGISLIGRRALSQVRSRVDD